MDEIVEKEIPHGVTLISVIEFIWGFLGILSGLIIFHFSPESVRVWGIIILLAAGVPSLIISQGLKLMKRAAFILLVPYSLIAAVLSAYEIYFYGYNYVIVVDVAANQIHVNLGYISVMVGVANVFIFLYIILKWKSIVPKKGVTYHYVPRYRREKKVDAISAKVVHVDPSLKLGEKETSPDTLAILCPICLGATPVPEDTESNVVKCKYCGAEIALSGVYTPCKNHPDRLAVAKCSVCGNYFCQECLTAQEPPADPRWTGEMVFLCNDCFHGRYVPAVTAAAIANPSFEVLKATKNRMISSLSLIKNFIYGYFGKMKRVILWGLRLAAELARGSDSDGLILIVLGIVAIIVGIPIAISLVTFAATLVILPILFYAGMIGVAINAIRIVRGTDFVSIEDMRLKKIKEQLKLQRKMRKKGG